MTRAEAAHNALSDSDDEYGRVVMHMLRWLRILPNL